MKYKGKTLVVSKSIGLKGYAWRLAKEKAKEYGYEHVNIYLRDQLYDVDGRRMFHDTNWYFELCTLGKV